MAVPGSINVKVDMMNAQAFRDFVTHADTVATRLVEIICEQEQELRQWERMARQANRDTMKASDDRDAFRELRDAADREIEDLRARIARGES